jgi:hypothetical protein
MKRLLIILAGFSTGIVLTAGLATVGTASSTAVSKARASAAVLIRHQLHGCHAWSVNGGPFRVSQAVKLRSGGSITVTNADVMPHKLVKTSGPAVLVRNLKGTGMQRPSAPGSMNQMGAKTKVWFAHKGVYRFTTKPGQDYMSGVKTVGKDNVLRFTVKVS